MGEARWGVNKNLKKNYNIEQKFSENDPPMQKKVIRKALIDPPSPNPSHRGRGIYQAYAF